MKIKYKEFSYIFGKECEVEERVDRFVQEYYVHKLYDKEHILLKSMLVKMIENGLYSPEELSELFNINILEII